MNTFAYCKNCSNITSSDFIGKECHICGHTLEEFTSELDYDNLLHNNNIFNKDLSMFYYTYSQFPNYSDNFLLNLNQSKDYLIVIVNYNKNNINNEYDIFDSLMVFFNKEFYLIDVDLMKNKVSLNKIVPNEHYLKEVKCKLFKIILNDNEEDLPYFDKQNERIYEYDRILKYLNFINIGKIKEYVSFNRLIVILRHFGIEFFQKDIDYLCSFNTFYSHPDIYDSTEELFCSNTDTNDKYEKYLGKVSLKNTILYNIYKDINEDEVIKYNLNKLNITNYASLYMNLKNIPLFLGIEGYTIYKYCKALNYNSTLLFFNVIDNKKNTIFASYWFSYIEYNDNFILIFDDIENKYNFNDCNLKGISIFSNKEQLIEFIGRTIENECSTFMCKELDTLKFFCYNGDLKLEKFDTKNDYMYKCIKEIEEQSVIKEDSKNSKIKNKRKEICEKIYTVMSLLDKTGKNLEKYQNMLEPMSDDQFDKFIKDFLKDDSRNFYLEVLPNKNEPSLRDIKKTLEYLKVPMDEYIYYRHDGNKSNPLRTRYKVPVGYIHLKRLQQMLQKKNTYSMSIDKRSLKTNQVTGEDKIARITDVENYSLTAIGADEALKEFLGPRADSEDSKLEMYKQISNQGYTYLKDLPNDISKKRTLNTINSYLIGAGLASDLVGEDFLEIASNTKNLNKML